MVNGLKSKLGVKEWMKLLRKDMRLTGNTNNQEIRKILWILGLKKSENC